MERRADVGRRAVVRCTRTGGRRGALPALLVATVLVAILAVSLVSLALADTPSFPDVPITHPEHAAIVDLASRGIVNGYPTGQFGPNDDVKRQQFAKMIVLAGGYPVSEANVCPFADVTDSGPDELYPDNYVAVCAAAGITVGRTATEFDPYSSITRLQVVSMVVRAADDLQPGLLPAPPAGWTSTPGWDLDATHGASAARAEYNGLLTGLDLSSLDARGAMTRGEVAQILSNLLAAVAPPSSTTTTASSTTTTASSTTTTTTAATTTTSDTSGGGGSGGGTTSPTVTPPPPVDHAVAGREAASVTAHVSDQFGNPFPGVEVFFTSEWPEGLAGLPELNVSAGPTDGFGNVAYSWEQTTAGAWGVEEVTARFDDGTPAGVSSAVKTIQWVYDDSAGTYVGAVSGQQIVTVYAGYAPWNGLVLSAHLNPKGDSLGSRRYVSSTDLSLTTTLHTWSSGQPFFLGAVSADDDGKPNWMYSIVP